MVPLGKYHALIFVSFSFEAQGIKLVWKLESSPS